MDIGCGDGALAAVLPHPPPVRVIGVDASATMPATHPGTAVRADARALPLASGVASAAAAVTVLDHMDEPTAAIREAHRVLKPGGLFLATAISRGDSPELAHVWRPVATSFDAEEAPALVASVFGSIGAHRWDAPLIDLPSSGAVRDYLIGRQVPPERAAAAACRVPTPLTLTKRGVLISGRKKRGTG
ncbi:SAM-dependent methyltransferase [Lipingzhangella halophila]|uniref:SAM-dependent methyltransferase n=1 Tax=Lipingzhangella halophila TaxID=1783352 RepID=A0A7W7W4Z0_9ACTN|nr:SAM-dependent methyltransferase [Lipingzhangella halophila]